MKGLPRWMVLVSFLMFWSNLAQGQVDLPPIDPLRPQPPARIEVEHVPGQALVKFHKNVSDAQIASIHAQVGAEVVSIIRGINVYVVRGAFGQSAEALLQAYWFISEVDFVEPNGIMRPQLAPNDPRFNELWGLHNTGQTGGTADADIDAFEAWDRQTGSANEIIAVIDTGVDRNHPDLAVNMWTNPGETPGNGVDDDLNGFIDDQNGWDFYFNDNDPMDDDGHGSHVAGTIAAVGNNGIGVAGINWRARIMSLKVCGGNPPVCPFSAIASGIQICRRQGSEGRKHQHRMFKLFFSSRRKCPEQCK